MNAVFNSSLFSNVTSSGLTTVTTTVAPPPEGTGQFQLSGGLYYDFDTTASFSCPCTITVSYPAGTQNPRLYHLENGVWTDVTTSVNKGQKTVTGVVSSFSFFAVGEPNYSVLWRGPIKERIKHNKNPFELKDEQHLDIKFRLLDIAGQLTTPSNVAVEIWQTMDAAGADITPSKVLTLAPELKNNGDYKSDLRLKETPLGLGTYEIRVLVDNTTASQTPTALFTLVED